MDSDRVVLNSRVNRESSFDAHIGRHGWSSTGRPNLGAWYGNGRVSDERNFSDYLTVGHQLKELALRLRGRA